VKITYSQFEHSVIDLCRFGTLNRMQTTDAFADFCAKTLCGVSGTWGKLAYMSELRRHGKGRYAHWGMEYYHGKDAAQQAMADAHKNLVDLLLTLRCRDILDEIRLFSELRGIDVIHAYRAVAEDFLDQLPEVTRTERRHVRVTLLTVEALLASAEAQAA
jgi:hypothetical protein